VLGKANAWRKLSIITGGGVAVTDLGKPPKVGPVNSAIAPPLQCIRLSQLNRIAT
jgi:hypothetical protein